MEPTPHIPTHLGAGRYRIQEVLGEGGSAWVLLAHDTRMDVLRAIKLLHPTMAHATGNRARFKNEARAQAGLKHPNILMVHDVVEDDDGIYLVMELAEGGSLAGRVEKGGPLPVREVVEIGATLCRALQEAHSAGVIHRDIKPGNILVDRSGIIKLADFGIARVLDRDVRLTETGMIIGTWAYMPPEQRDASAPADPRADIYALGVTLYYLLTGESAANLHNREGHERAFAGIPPGIASVIQRATRMFPDDRYATCADFALDLHRVLQSPDTMVADPPTRPVPPVPEGRTLVPGLAATGPGAAPPPAGGAVTAVPVATTEDEPTRPSSALPWVAAGAVGLVGLITLALAAMVLIPRLLPADTQLEPEATTAGGPAASAIPTAGAPPGGAGTATEPAPASPTTAAPTQVAAALPASTAAPGPAPTTGAGGAAGHTPRVISVVADPSAGPAPTTPPPGAATPTDRSATGTVVLRTIPSGATVSEGGVTLKASPNGAYELKVGSHVLDVRSPVGEPTRLPVFVRSGQTVTICHSFDTNSACGSEP